MAGPIEVGGTGGSQGEAGETLVEQEAVSQLQGGKGTAVGQQLGRRRVEPPALIGRGNGQHAEPGGKGRLGQGQTLAIEQVQVQAAEAEPLAGQGRRDQVVAAMAAETHLAHQAFTKGPGEQLRPRPPQGPVQVLWRIDPMDGQVVEPGQAQAFQAAAQLLLGLGQIRPGQNLGGDHQASPAGGIAALELAQGLA